VSKKQSKVLFIYKIGNIAAPVTDEKNRFL